MEPWPFCKAGFVVQDPAFKPGQHPYRHAGVFYSQEPSASSAAPLLGVRPGMRVLDTCARPPAARAASWRQRWAGRGLLVSNEFVAARARGAPEKQSGADGRAQRRGAGRRDAGRIAAALPEFFDRVLVEGAPCSGEGMFRKEAAGCDPAL